MTATAVFCFWYFYLFSHRGHRLGGNELIAGLLPFAAEAGHPTSGLGLKGFRFAVYVPETPIFLN